MLRSALVVSAMLISANSFLATAARSFTATSTATRDHESLWYFDRHKRTKALAACPPCLRNSIRQSRPIPAIYRMPRFLRHFPESGHLRFNMDLTCSERLYVGLLG